MKDDISKWLAAEPQTEELIEKGEYNRALKLALEKLNTSPQDISLLRICAYCHTELRQFTEADNYIKKLSLNDSAIDFLRSNWYMRQSKFTLAEKILVNANRQKNDFDSLIQLARFYEIIYSINRYRLFKLPGTQKKIENKFLNVVNKVNIICDKIIIAEKLKASFYLKNIKYKKALENLNNLINLSPNDPWTYIRFSWIYISYKKYKTARSFLDKGLAISPNDKLGNFLLSRVEQNGDKDRINTDTLQFKTLTILVFLLLFYFFGHTTFHGVPSLFLFKVGFILLFIFLGGSKRTNKKDLRDLAKQGVEQAVPNFS